MSDDEIHNLQEDGDELDGEARLQQSAGDGDEDPNASSTQPLVIPSITITPPEIGEQDDDEPRPIKKQNKNLLMLPGAEVDEDEPGELDPEESGDSLPEPEPLEATEELPPLSYKVEILYPTGGENDYARVPVEPEPVDADDAASTDSSQLDPVPEEPETEAIESEPEAPESEPLETSPSEEDDQTDAEARVAEAELGPETLTVQELEAEMLPYEERGQSCSELEPFIQELAKISPEQAAMHACWRNVRHDSKEELSPLPEKFYPEDFGSPKETLHEIPPNPEPRTYNNGVSASTSYAVQDMNAMLESIPKEFLTSADSVGLPPTFHPSDQSVEDGISRAPATYFSDTAPNMRTCPAVPVELKGISRMMKEWAADCGHDIMITLDTLTGMETEPCNLCDAPQPNTLGIFGYLYDMACDIVAEATGHADERDMAILARDEASADNCAPRRLSTERKLSEPMTGLTRDENGELMLDPDAPDGVLFDNTANFEARFEGDAIQSQPNISMRDPHEFEDPEQRAMLFQDKSNATAADDLPGGVVSRGAVPEVLPSQEALYRKASHEAAVRVASELYQAALAEEGRTIPPYEESASPFSEEGVLSGQTSPVGQWLMNGEWKGGVSDAENAPTSVDISSSQNDQWFEPQESSLPEEVPSSEEFPIAEEASVSEKVPSVVKNSASEDDQFFESDNSPSYEQPLSPEEDASSDDASEDADVAKKLPSDP